MFNLNDENMENCPLNIFINLYAENKENKLYEQMLKDETKNVTEALKNELSIEEVIVLKSLIDASNNIINEQEVEEVLKVRVQVTKQILDAVYENKIKEESHD